MGKPSAVDTGKVILLATSASSVSNSSDNWVGFGFSAPPQTASFKSWIFPFAATIKSFKFNALTQPAGAASYTGTIEINGSVISATDCAVTASVGICDWFGSVSVSAGDTAAVKVHPSGTPTSSVITTSIGYTPTTTNDTAIASGAVAGGYSTSTTQYMAPFQSDTPVTAIGTTQMGVFPDGGTVDKLYVASNAPGTVGSGKSYAYNAVKTGVASTLTASIADDATANNDTTHSFSVTAGTDFLQFRAVPTSTPASAKAVLGVRYVPTTAARYAYSFNTTSSPPNTGGATFYSITAGGNSNSTESLRKGITHSQTFEKIYAKVSAAPTGATKQWTVTVRVNFVDTALSCIILNTATSCTATGTVAASDNDYVDVSVTPANSPGFAAMGVSLLATR